ncbi:acyltransferase [Maribacter spongiicola]|uniref:acyltransferase n=1 Tax=Maribacter spongiicola TaxID=1206753 RepID=UPI003F987B04
MQRSFSIDILRSIAAIQVVIIHITTYYINNDFNGINSGLSFWTANILDSFCRISVPLFVLISGKYLLGKRESYIIFFKKRGSRILIPTIIWTLIYITYRIAQNYLTGRGLFERSILEDFITGRSFYHMWYLYMLIGLYLVTPGINFLIQKVSRIQLWFIAISFLLLGFLMDINYSFLENNYFFFWFVNYIGYYIVGYLLREIKVISLSIMLISYVSCSIGIAYFTYESLLNSEQLYYTKYLSPFVIIPSILVYGYFEGISLSQNFLSRLSKYTFGIYLIHPLILDMMHHANKLFKMNLINYPLFEIIGRFVICMLISISVIFMLSKTKHLNKII